MRILKSLLFALLLLVPLSSLAGTQKPQTAPLPFQKCQAWLPFTELPTGPHKAVTPICRQAYLAEYDFEAKIPVWVAYPLTPDHAMGCLARSNAFASDRSQSKDRQAHPSDYANSGYDMGHVAPDGDMSWDLNVERESFLLSNMTPQLPGLNRISWKALESAVRAWAFGRGHLLLIYDGPIYDSAKDKKIGKSGVVVPDTYFKIVLDTETHEFMVFLFPQQEGMGTDITKFLSTFAEFQKQSGLMFLLPDDAKESSSVWPIDITGYNSAKKQKCGHEDN